MNKLYIILPLVAMIVFAFVFSDFNKKYTIEQEAKKQAAAAEQAAREAEEAKLANQAAQEAIRRQEERVAKAEEDKRIAREKQEAEDRELVANIERTKRSIDQVQKELNEAEMKLVQMRQDREKAEADAFALARDVELTRIARRNAELELQRAAEMMADRTESSALVVEPLFPATQASAKKAD